MKKFAILALMAAALATMAVMLMRTGGNRPESAVSDTLDVADSETYEGRVADMLILEIRAHVPGFIDHIYVENGDTVVADQPLFAIYDGQYMARVNYAEAQLVKEKAMLNKAKRDLERIQPLYDQNAASRLDLDNAQAACESAKASVQMAEADLSQARREADLTITRSPARGRLNFKGALKGRLVGPGSGVVLATLTRTDTVQVDVTVPGDVFLELAKTRDRKAVVTLTDGTEYPAAGTVCVAEPTVDPESGNFTFAVRLPITSVRLYNGQHVTVKIANDGK